jgi:hypothetical protein
MKFIVIPPIRFIFVVLLGFVGFIVVTLICVWEGNVNEFRKFKKPPFLDGWDDGNYYTYPTAKDWILYRKHYTKYGRD